MTKVNRTFRIDEDLSKKLNDITVPPYTYTWHLEKALTAYLNTDLIKRIRDQNDN